MSERQLTIHDHSRDSAGMRYVYPVVSRRAGGVSVGINLNVNNACNWACVYCQVPGLTRGGPPPVDLERLDLELRQMLGNIAQGDYLLRHAPPEARRLVDVAFSGNGEPTSAQAFPEAVAVAAGAMADLLAGEKVPLRLITNGSQLHRAGVQHGIARLAQQGGEVWFKFDRATIEGIARVNGVRMQPQRALVRLRRCAELAPTWVQTCFFAIDGSGPSADEREAYLAAVAGLRGVIEGVQLYGLARPSMQPDASRLSAVAASDLESFAAEIGQLGIRVAVSP